MGTLPRAFGGFGATVREGDRAVHAIPVRGKRLFRVRHNRP
ncbi:hypothetical protein [Umezawaea sp. Da 62-37]|nr:hypothetical protein [Umezawaea sp. Da 62-37]WNV85197.1 hypothetical protein RM788_44885 [Umezawaea sp. Da 62-37]